MLLHYQRGGKFFLQPSEISSVEPRQYRYASVTLKNGQVFHTEESVDEVIRLLGIYMRELPK